MVKLVEEFTLITLMEIKEKLKSEYNLEISKTTISRYLDEQFYSLKLVHREPDYYNSLENKEKGWCNVPR